MERLFKGEAYRPYRLRYIYSILFSTKQIRRVVLFTRIFFDNVSSNRSWGGVGDVFA
ncbi:MAG: hypothetical protein LBH59_02435 [Planctomycetaceae bacterium]|nr:hypothetical protein [Planctomycetaceae bacterium]